MIQAARLTSQSDYVSNVFLVVPQKLDVESRIWTDYRWLDAVADTQPFSGLWL